MQAPTVPPEFDVDKNSKELDAEYALEAMEYFRLKDSKQLKRIVKIDLQISNPDLTKNVFFVLFDWLYTVRKKFKFGMETWFLACNYTREYILVSRNIAKKKAQLIGVTALFIASKFEEIYFPQVRDFDYISAHTYSEKQILECEQEIIAAVDWNLSQVSIWTFIGRVSQLAEQFIPKEKYKELKELLMYYICVPNFDFSLFQKYLTLDLALACYWLAAFTLDLPTWHEYFTVHFRKNEKELEQVVLDLFPIFQEIRKKEKLDFHPISLQHKLPKTPTKSDFK